MNIAQYFKNQPPLNQALIHRSYLNEHRQVSQSNERLEFLGDAVLELVITEHLYHHFPKKSEGDLTALRSALVKTQTLGQVAKGLGVGDLLKMSHGEEQSGGRTNLALLANTLEAIIGALYLDQGLLKAQDFIHKHLLPLLPTIISRKLYQDFKSTLQETSQSRGFLAPTYKVVKSIGPDHRREFTVTVSVNGKAVAHGTGLSKQVAEQSAAHSALEKLEKK